MLNSQNVYLLLGKKPRSVLKTITEKKNDRSFTHLEKTKETICYFSYPSEDVEGTETLTLYIDNRIIDYDELQIGQAYYLSYGNSNVDFIISQKDYNEVLYKDLESYDTSNE